MKPLAAALQQLTHLIGFVLLLLHPRFIAWIGGGQGQVRLRRQRANRLSKSLAVIGHGELEQIALSPAAKAIVNALTLTNLKGWTFFLMKGAAANQPVASPA